MRQAQLNDYLTIVDRIQRWWGDSRTPEQARELSLLFPRLFLQHFAGTSLVEEDDSGIRGFLIGFHSADRADQAYIHFVGVDPELRGQGLARRLYTAFFDAAARSGRSTVRAITSPANTGSIAFHRAMGFSLEAGDHEVGGVPVHSDYDSRGEPRVCFVKRLPATAFDPHALLADSRLGVLATLRSDGRPQLSPVMPYYDRPADTLYVSMTEGRAKTANLRRDPRATLEVTSADGKAWATAEGTATLTGPGTDPRGPRVEALVEYYRTAAGEHPDWDEYRATMVSDRRVLMTMKVEHVYGARIG